jgi:hypothetical protein
MQEEKLNPLDQIDLVVETNEESKKPETVVVEVQT